MEVIKILYAKLVQEKGEKEFSLERVLNNSTLSSDFILSESAKILKEIATIEMAIVSLEKYIGHPLKEN